MRENFMVHVVYSDQAIADGLATLLGTYGIEVMSHPDAESFLELWAAQRSRNCCLVTEADLPGLGGAALLRELHEQRVDIPVLMLVGTAPPEWFEDVPGSDRVTMIRKPCLDRGLIDRILGFRDAGAAERHRGRRAGNH